MKYLYSLIVVMTLVIATNAQARSLSKPEYDGTITRALATSNSTFPLLLTVTGESVKDGKTLFAFKEVHERQAEGVKRVTRSFTRDGKTTYQYQLTVGAESVYCSEDGANWTGPWPYECAVRSTGESSSAERIDPEHLEYRVESDVVRTDVKLYREYIVFVATTPKSKRRFKETVSKINSQGSLLEVVETEGTLVPRKVTAVRKRTWAANGKFAPIVAPVK